MTDEQEKQQQEEDNNTFIEYVVGKKYQSEIAGHVIYEGYSDNLPIHRFTLAYYPDATRYERELGLISELPQEDIS